MLRKAQAQLKKENEEAIEIMTKVQELQSENNNQMEMEARKAIKREAEKIKDEVDAKMKKLEDEKKALINSMAKE